MKYLITLSAIALLTACGNDSNNTVLAAADDDACAKYFAKVEEACRRSIHDGLDVSCKQLFTEADIVADQYKGKLFSDPNKQVSATDIGAAMCEGGLKTLNETLDKAPVKAAPDWGPKCGELVSRIDQQCLPAMGQGTFDGQCKQWLQRLDMAKGMPDPEMMCAF